MFILKYVDLTTNGNITDKVSIVDNKLIIIENSDKIELRENGWYINNVYQGKDASYIYKVENPLIIDKNLFDKIFEKEIEE